MGKSVDMQTLRRRAARLLDELQALPGFSDALRAVGPTPDLATEWSWSAVVNATEYESWRPGTVRWESLSMDDRPPQVIVGDPDADPPPVSAGMALSPVSDALPEEADRDALVAYRERISSFAATYVLDVEWGPRAVHDATRLERPLRLPDRPERFVNVPLDAPFTLDPDQPLLVSQCVELGRALLQAAEEATRDEHIPRGTIPKGSIWEDAVETVRVRLGAPEQRDTPPGTSRSNLSRVKVWLDLAVTDFAGETLHKADARDYVEKRRARERSAGLNEGT